MGAHTTAADAGASWDALEAVDVDQPHGKDYLYAQNIAKGVRKRLSQEHVLFADSTVGGIHKPGGSAILGMDITDDCTAGVAADGTYRGHGLVWSLSDTSNWGVLFCSTAAAGATTSGDWTVMRVHPDLQWGGGDITWAGAHEFDGSVDFTGPISVNGTSNLTDVSFSGVATIFGADTSQDGDGVDFAHDVTYKVTTDGILSVTFYHASAVEARLYADETAGLDGDSRRGIVRGTGTVPSGTITMPIRKNQYWCVSLTSGTMSDAHWYPYGDGSCDKDI